MFVLPERQNPLGQIFQGLTEAAGPYLQQRKAQKSSQALFDTLSQIDEGASPLEFTRLLHSNPNILPEHRASALKSYTDIQNAQSRQAQANRPRSGMVGTGPGEYTASERSRWAQHVQDAVAHGEEPRSIDEFYGRTEAPRQQSPDQDFETEPRESPNRIGAAESTQTAQEKPLSERFLPRYRGKAAAEWKKHNQTANLPIFNEAAARIKGIEAEAIDILQLDNINQSGKLLEDSSKFLIDPETNDFYSSVKKLGIPSPLQQLYVKTTLGRMRGIKDILGSQMTQGEVQMYMSSLPTLLNSPEGRSLIIKQMQLMEEYNMADDEELTKVYEQAGLENIPPAEARKLARAEAKPKKDRIKKELKDLAMNASSLPVEPRATQNETPIASAKTQLFEQLPDPSPYKEGKIAYEDGKPAYKVHNGRWEKI